MTPPVVAFVARSGTGKTTLIEQVIALLKARGWQIGAFKHDAHAFEIDKPGKDSYRFTAAGADVMLIASQQKLALVRQYAAPPSPAELLAAYFPDVDLVIAEGLKSGEVAKIEVHRAACNAPLLCRGAVHDPLLLAVVSDEALDLDVPLLALEDAAGVADFLEERFLR